MRTIIIDVTNAGAKIELQLAKGRTSGQAVLVLTDDVQLGAPSRAAGSPQVRAFNEFESRNDFPPRRLTEQTIVQILKEHGGTVRIRDDSGWNIYDEVAARLGVSIEARSRMTEGTGEPAWRPEVGYCRKNLEQAGSLEPTDVSGRGVWQLRQELASVKR